MNILTELEALAAKFEGEAKTVIAELVAKVHSDKATLIGSLEAEIAKGTPELQAIWSKLRTLL